MRLAGDTPARHPPSLWVPRVERRANAQRWIHQVPGKPGATDVATRGTAPAAWAARARDGCCGGRRFTVGWRRDVASSGPTHGDLFITARGRGPGTAVAPDHARGAPSRYRVTQAADDIGDAGAGRRGPRASAHSDALQSTHGGLRDPAGVQQRVRRPLHRVLCNRDREQWIFTLDRATGVASLRGGDVNWGTVHRVRDGRIEGLILSPQEAAWLQACWSAANAPP